MCFEGLCHVANAPDSSLFELAILVLRRHRFLVYGSDVHSETCCRFLVYGSDVHSETCCRFLVYGTDVHSETCCRFNSGYQASRALRVRIPVVGFLWRPLLSLLLLLTLVFPDSYITFFASDVCLLTTQLIHGKNSSVVDKDFFEEVSL